MRWNNKHFPSLYVINNKTSPHIMKGILRRYHYPSNLKLVPGIIVIRSILSHFYACTTILSLSWDLETKEAQIYLIHGKVYNYKYSHILGCHNNWIIMVFK